MSTCIIFNPNAGSAERIEQLRQHVEQRVDTELLETSQAEDTEPMALDAARRGHRLIIGAGGDGTVHAIVNGIMTSRRSVTLGIIPLGTGNDLPRTLGIPEEPLAALELIHRGAIRSIDLIKVRCDRKTRYGHNVAAGGFTGQLDEAMTEQIKQTWGPLAYIRGAVNVLPDLTKYRTAVRLDGKASQRIPAMNIIVANGRTAGGGIVVAPRANPEDGLLDVVIVRTGTMLELTGVAARLLAGDYTNSDIVTHHRAKRVEVKSEPGMWFNVDGELFSNRDIVFSVVSHALKVIVGPDYSPTAFTTR